MHIALKDRHSAKFIAHYIFPVTVRQEKVWAIVHVGLYE